MDSKRSRLQALAKESATGHDNDQSRLVSYDLFQNHLDRVQNFFNRRSNSSNDGSALNAEDMQILLQKGDNDPILPSLVRRSRVRRVSCEHGVL